MLYSGRLKTHNMKYILIVCLLAFLSCKKVDEINKSNTTELKKKPVVTIINIDGCEYIQVWAESYNPSAYGGGWYVKYALTHKGNCFNPIHNHK